jgi:PRTRC genetic system protein E
MATTNFFAQVAAIPFEGCLNITIRKDGEQQTVSVLVQNEACGDTAKAHIPPLILKGDVKELGEGFFPAITAPVQQASALLLNMEQFLKGQENAKKHSAMEKKKEGKTEKTATASDPKATKFDKAMAQVDSLEAEGKFREAWMKVPQASEFPEKAEELRSRRASLSAKFSPGLFGAEQPTTEKTEPNTEDYATDDDTAEGIPYQGERE